MRNDEQPRHADGRWSAKPGAPEQSASARLTSPSPETPAAEGVSFDPRTAEAASAKGIDLAELAAVVHAPADQWRTRDGKQDVYKGRDWAVVIEVRTGNVLRFMPADLAKPPAVRAPVERSKYPGKRPDGLRRLTTADELVRACEAHGLQVLRGAKHPVITDGTRKLALPGTPSDHRSIENTRTQIKRKFGVDVRQPVPSRGG